MEVATSIISLQKFSSIWRAGTHVFQELDVWALSTGLVGVGEHRVLGLVLKKLLKLGSIPLSQDPNRQPQKRLHLVEKPVGNNPEKHHLLALAGGVQLLLQVLGAAIQLPGQVCEAPG